MTDEELRQQFHDTGVLRFDGAFTVAQAAMRDAIWHFIEKRTDVRRDDPATWPDGPRLNLSFKSMRRGVHFEPLLGNPAVQQALAATFGPDGWDRTRGPKAQILLTFPTPGPWTMPDGWHMDCAFQRPTWPVFAMKGFAFFDEVEPTGGGTFVLEGSHRLVERYTCSHPERTGGNSAEWTRFMKQDPWLDQVRRGGPGRDLVGATHEVDGIPLRVVELTGQPGDIVLTHLHVFHSTSPNTTARPRQMLGTLVTAAGPPPAS